MSIFSSKKSRPKEIEADRSKQKASTVNGAKAQPNGHGQRNGTANAIQNAALSAGARTIQRAQIMAASRKRMDSDTPDWTIQGAAKSKGSAPRAGAPSPVSVSAARQAAEAGKSNVPAEPKSRSSNPPQKLSKAQPKATDEKKSRASSMNNVTQNGATTATPIYAALQTMNPSAPASGPNDEPTRGSTNNLNMPFQKTPSMPLDSPTLGYDGFSKPPQSPDTAPAARSFSGSPKVQAVLAAADSVRVGRPSRNDSGTEPIPDTSTNHSITSKMSKTSGDGQKQTTAGVPPGLRAESKTSNRSSTSSTYISKLDPGPTGSAFADPVPSPGDGGIQLNGENGSKRPREASRSQRFQREDAPEQKTRSAAATPHAFSQYANRDKGSSGLNRIVAASQGLPASQKHSSAPQSRKEEKPFTQSRQSPISSPTSRGVETAREATTRTYTLPNSPPAVVETSRTYTLPTSPSADTGAFRTAPTSAANTPPITRESQDLHAGSTSSQSVVQPSDSYFSKPAIAPAAQAPVIPASVLSQPTTSRSSIDQRSEMPPISILEGFKVNKRGHILDEEGQVIGELFEGDLIDCVRQKVDANGDVLDESGAPVGRVRTIVRGTIMAPRWSISSGTSLPLSTYNWGRRGSTASQQTYQTQQSHPTFYNRGSVSHATPPTIEGNSFVAELDASNEAEAGPVVDHSEIFSPFGVPQRPGSASTTASVSELAADETRTSQSSKPEAKPEARRESVAAEEFPKPTRKWTSRYFESSPIEGELSARRNSASAAVVQSPITIASPKSPNVIYGSVSATKSRVVIGPTLESLMEQDPSLLTSFSDKRSFGGSTPNLPLPASKSGASSPRRASNQFGAPAAGLSGNRLSVKGPISHQPARRSPLGNFETTPPRPMEDDTMRTKSLPGERPKFTTKASKASMEAEDAAPAPEIAKKKWQEKRVMLSVPDSDKVAEKRKSRFSFMLGR